MDDYLKNECIAFALASGVLDIESSADLERRLERDRRRQRCQRKRAR